MIDHLPWQFDRSLVNVRVRAVNGVSQTRHDTLDGVKM